MYGDIDIGNDRMVIPNDFEHVQSGDTGWCLLLEYPLEQFIEDHISECSEEPGLLSQTIIELGVDLQLLKKIDRKLAELAQASMRRLDQGQCEVLTYIRLFCQKALKDDNSAGSYRSLKDGQAIKNTQAVDYTGAETNSGWGYFLVERNGGSQPGERSR